MGVETRLVLFARDSALAFGAANAAFARIAELDSLLSDYRMDSELNALNAAAGREPLVVSEDLARILVTALEVSAQTDGAFDVTAGPAVVLWREARRTGRAPDPASLERARSLTDWRRLHVELPARRVRLEREGMRIDLGGIAKGAAAEAARTVLRSHGIDRCLVALGGEIALGDAPPGDAGWSIELAGSTASGPVRELANTTIATSGDAEQVLVIDGVRYSHVIDPATGLGSSRGVSAIVIGPEGSLTDALATAATLLDGAGRARLAAAWPGYTFIVDPPDA